LSLGDLEQVALFAIVRLRGDAHGAAIVEQIESATGRRVAPGALYTVLDRLEAKGYVDSWIGDSTPVRGGRRRKVYAIRPEGARALRDWYEGIRLLAAGTGVRLADLAGEGG
jgi:DNA-binding PadR family transcriptional regulator